MKVLASLFLLIIVSGCASGRLAFYDSDGNVVGECVGGYDWHFYGVKDSVDWILNWCAQKAIKEGMVFSSVSDESILLKDYSYPNPKLDEVWNKKTAWKAFRSNYISEKEYGYILADIENTFYLKNIEAQSQLEAGVIDESQYNELIEKNKVLFYGE